MDNNSTNNTTSNLQAYELVNSFERSEEVAKQIIEASRSGETVIGVDCEGILRGRPLCLIQVSLHFPIAITNYFRFISKTVPMCLTY